MLTIEEIREKVQPIAKQYGLRRMYLFGSYAKNTAHEGSDLDFLYEKGMLPFTLLNEADLWQNLVDSFGCEVDLISVGGLDFWLEKEIKGTEVLLYEQ